MSRPIGPHVKPEVRHDEHGRYLVYPDKNCTAPGCGLLLTSRNRYQMLRLCREHGREQERARVRPRKTPKGAITLPPFTVGPLPPSLHSALSAWLSFPTEELRWSSLQVALKDHELKSRLRVLLPMPPAEPIGPIPVYEPTSINPEHRTTRLEFLADCSSHGV